MNRSTRSLPAWSILLLVVPVAIDVLLRLNGPFHVPTIVYMAATVGLLVVASSAFGGRAVRRLRATNGLVFTVELDGGSAERLAQVASQDLPTQPYLLVVGRPALELWTVEPDTKRTASVDWAALAGASTELVSKRWGRGTIALTFDGVAPIYIDVLPTVWERITRNAASARALCEELAHVTREATPADH